MGITAAIASVALGAGQMIAANQVNQDAKGAAGRALANAPNPLLDAANAAKQGNNAYNMQKRMAAGAAGGFGTTILTGPRGLNNTAQPGAPPPGGTRSTILGG